MAEKKRWTPLYQPHPRDWVAHPRKKMLMTPLLVVFGGLFAYAVPTLVAAFFHVMFFHPPVSKEWSPLPGNAFQGRRIFVSNGCLYCHSGYTRPQDVRANLHYLYVRSSLPGDFATSDESPNLFGTARIGPDLSQESGFHPDDWQHAHFFDPRFIEPDSIMPDFKFLSTQEVDDLTAFMQTRSEKSGLLRYSGQLYMKKLFLAAAAIPPPPPAFEGAKLTLADVAIEASNAPSPPPGSYGGLTFPDPINLNYVDRGYWLMDNPLPITNANILQGRFVFQQRCIGCHGQGGSAISNGAKFLSPTPIDFTVQADAVGGNDTSPGDLYYRALRGINGTAMENFGTRLKVEDIWKVIMFLKTIPNGGLQGTKVPTVADYIQWKPNPTLLAYIAQHPIAENRSYVDSPTPDPFMLEAQRNLAGLNSSETITPLPGVGPVSLDSAARDIRTIYNQLLADGWASYEARGGAPAVPSSQRDIPPAYVQEQR